MNTLTSNWNNKIDTEPHEEAYNRLYNDAKKQREKFEKIRKEVRDDEEEMMSNVRGDKRNERETDITANRLYSKSFKKQLEGKKLRESIEKKLAPRAPTPSRKIRPEQANKIYERGMLQKVALEMKREEATISRNYVSPLLDPLMPDETKPALKILADKNTTRSRIRPRSRLRSNSNPTQVHQIASSLPSSKTRPASTSSSFKGSPANQRFDYNRSSTPEIINSRSISMRKVPNTRTRSPTPARHRLHQYETEDPYY